MVTLVKPLKRKPATDAQILHQASLHILNGNDHYICYAIERVGRSIGSPKQIAVLIDRVREKIAPYAYYTQWAAANRPRIIESAKQGRLALIRKLIKEVTP
jgi:hypothetical protein